MTVTPRVPFLSSPSFSGIHLIHRFLSTNCLSSKQLLSLLSYLSPKQPSLFMRSTIMSVGWKKELVPLKPHMDHRLPSSAGIATFQFRGPKRVDHSQLGSLILRLLNLDWNQLQKYLRRKRRVERSELIVTTVELEGSDQTCSTDSLCTTVYSNGSIHAPDNTSSPQDLFPQALRVTPVFLL